MPVTDSSFTGKHGIRKVACACQRHPQLGCSSDQDYYQSERKGKRVFFSGLSYCQSESSVRRAVPYGYCAIRKGHVGIAQRRQAGTHTGVRLVWEGMRCRSYDDMTIRAW